MERPWGLEVMISKNWNFFFLKILMRVLSFQEQVVQEKYGMEYGGHGKRGGARVIYVDIARYEKIYFLVAYPKGVQENISPAEKKAISAEIKALKEELSEKNRR